MYSQYLVMLNVGRRMNVSH